MHMFLKLGRVQHSSAQLETRGHKRTELMQDCAVTKVHHETGMHDSMIFMCLL